MDDILMKREELCKLWPDYFFIINHEWAILAVKKHWHFKVNTQHEHSDLFSLLAQFVVCLNFDSN